MAPNQGWFKKKESLFINICYIVTILFPPLNCFVAEAQHAVLSSQCPCFPRVQKFLLTSGSFPPSHHLCTLLLLSQPLLHLTVFCGSVFLILNKTQPWQLLRDCVCTMRVWRTEKILFPGSEPRALVRFEGTGSSCCSAPALQKAPDVLYTTSHLLSPTYFLPCQNTYDVCEKFALLLGHCLQERTPALSLLSSAQVKPPKIAGFGL